MKSVSLFLFYSLRINVNYVCICHLKSVSNQIKQVNDYINANKSAKSTIGLRINPVVGGGNISMMSTATKLSKFGLPLMDETRERLIQIYVDNPWLTGIHIHVGSQGVPLERFVSGKIKGMN